jgi:DNA mismatch repair protein MutL
MLGNNGLATQRMLFPEVLFISNDDIALLSERREDFEALGFEYSITDEGAVEITGIPADFAVREIRPLLYNMIDILRDERTVDNDRARREHLAASLSREAVYHQNPMQQQEIEALLTMLSTGNYNYTVDGRAVLKTVNYQ